MDGLFTTLIYPLKFKRINDVYTLLHIGDTHFEHEGHCKSRWQKFRKKHGNRPKTIALGMGDYWDFSRWSDRQAMRRGGVSQSAYERMDRMVIEDVKRSRDEFCVFTWIGLLAGNHDWSFGEDTIKQLGCTTATEYLAKLLDTPFLGNCTYIHFALDYGGKRTRVSEVAHHGAGQSRTITASINKLHRWAEAFWAHIYAMGHDHSSFVLPCPNTPLHGYVNKQTGKLEMAEHEPWYVRTGSMLKGYAPGMRSYIAQKALPARRLVYPEVFLGIQRERSNKSDSIKPSIEGLNPKA